MTPFQQLRLWARRAPIEERLAAVAGAVLAVAILGWVILPITTSGKSGQRVNAGGTQGQASGSAGGATNPGQLSGSTGPGATGVLGGSSAAGSVGLTSSGQANTAGLVNGITNGSECTTPAGSDHGVTATQIRIAVTIVNIAGPAANSLFGIATPANQQTYFQAVIDGINAAGGVACRKLAPTFLSANPADQSDLQQKCLTIAQSGVFAEIDPGAYAIPGPLCFAQHQVPYFGGNFHTAEQGLSLFPYVFDLNQYDSLYRNTVFALRDRGFFSPANGFNKLGYIYRSCNPEVISEEFGWLHQIGLSGSQVVPYDVGCPSDFANPYDLSQAILKFQQAGVTNMTTSFFVGDMQNFTRIAETQKFRPKWGVPDDNLISTAYGSMQPNSTNMANAISITGTRDGEERTPGMSPTAGTVRCNTYLQAHGLRPVYQLPAEAGNACDQLWMFQAAVEHAPLLQRAALAAGLEQLRSIDFSFPAGPNDFTGDHATTGGQYWRVAQFFPGCKCWRLIDQTFHPSYL